MLATQTVDSARTKGPAPHGTRTNDALPRSVNYSQEDTRLVCFSWACLHFSISLSLHHQGLICQGVCNHAFMSWEQRNAVTQPLGNVCRAEGGSAFCLPMWGAHGVWPPGGRVLGLLNQEYRSLCPHAHTWFSTLSHVTSHPHWATLDYLKLTIEQLSDHFLFSDYNLICPLSGWGIYFDI